MERYVTGGAVGVYEKGGAEEMEPGEAPAVRVLILIWGCHEGMSPIQVLQYIASGALGSDAFKGGLATAALGAALHFFIAFVVANGVFGHAIFVGLPIAWFARRSASKN